ncbi:SDR family oxidoreductase [Aliiglaciecola sp. M165]|uniref:SDR family oxidoreductase n=1 Tax=Aliiglaciecola sp. M165 TaxID=2593649 RepID=UPI00163DD3D7|nr:SDR family oxidoreductase [Aliiglaciecola sp. M165]
MQQSSRYRLSNKTAIVTGGGKGLGKTLTYNLLKQGMQVAICGRSQKDIDSTVNEFDTEFNGKIFGQACNVKYAEQVKSFVEAVADKFGDVHVLVNNSGFGKDTLVWETSEEDWDDVMNTNVKGAFLMSKAVLPKMIENSEGFIINIASQAALNGYANAGVYCASKFAMVGLGKALQEEVKPYGIHVHSLNPALIQSQKTEEEAIDSGLIQNQDLAYTLLFLLTQPRRLKIDNIGMWGF